MYSIKNPDLIAFEVNEVAQVVTEYADGFAEVIEDGLTVEETINNLEYYEKE